MIAPLAEPANVVFLDTPSAIAVTDAAVLEAKLDGVLLVINVGKTRREHADRAKEMLERANVRGFGAALTNAHKNTSIGGYHE
jgi:non-specific protein-tyrosine kinase